MYRPLVGVPAGSGPGRRGDRRARRQSQAGLVGHVARFPSSTRAGAFILPCPGRRFIRNPGISLSSREPRTARPAQAGAGASLIRPTGRGRTFGHRVALLQAASGASSSHPRVAHAAPCANPCANRRHRGVRPDTPIRSRYGPGPACAPEPSRPGKPARRTPPTRRKPAAPP